MPYGFEYKKFRLTNYLKKGGAAIICKDTTIYLYKGKQKIKLIDTKQIPFTFKGRFKPSIYNIMAAIAAITVYKNFKVNSKLFAPLKKYKMAETGSRLVEKNIKGRKIIIDFAHETESLKQILNLGKNLGKRCFGVVRLAPDRTDEHIKKVGRSIASIADQYFVWDKIDGVKRKFYKSVYLGIPRRTGEISTLLTSAIKEKNKNVKNYIQEEKAIKAAALQSTKGDCIIIIAGDDSKDTLKYIQKYFSTL